MSFVKIGNKYLNTDAIQYAKQIPEKDLVSVHFLNTSIQLTMQDWQTVLKATDRDATR